MRDMGSFVKCGVVSAQQPGAAAWAQCGVVIVLLHLVVGAAKNTTFSMTVLFCIFHYGPAVRSPQNTTILHFSAQFYTLLHATILYYAILCYTFYGILYFLVY